MYDNNVKEEDDENPSMGVTNSKNKKGTSSKVSDTNGQSNPVVLDVDTTIMVSVNCFLDVTSKQTVGSVVFMAIKFNGVFVVFHFPLFFSSRTDCVSALPHTHRCSNRVQ